MTATVSISGPVMSEVSTVVHMGTTALWHASRVFTLPNSNDGGMGEAVVEQAYVVDALDTNQDLVARFSTGLSTSGMLHTDQVGSLDRNGPKRAAAGPLRAAVLARKASRLA